MLELNCILSYVASICSILIVEIRRKKKRGREGVEGAWKFGHTVVYKTPRLCTATTITIVHNTQRYSQFS